MYVMVIVAFSKPQSSFRAGLCGEVIWPLSRRGPDSITAASSGVESPWSIHRPAKTSEYVLESDLPRQPPSEKEYISVKDCKDIPCSGLLVSFLSFESKDLYSQIIYDCAIQ